MTVTLESLKKAVGKKKSPSRAYAWLADMERASGDLDGALRRVDGGLGLYMNDLPGLLVRSRILFEKGEYEDCVAVCKMALKNDQFCLSAQKRMGEAYEKLGNDAERNKCFRRVHDMDPLDNFWKEEYDVVLATAAAVADSDFVMPGLTNDDSEITTEDDGGLSFLTSGGEESSLVKENSFNTEESSSAESSLFEKSLDSEANSSSIFSSSSTGESSSPFSLDMKSPIEDINVIEPTLDEEESKTTSAEEDPFAALSSLISNDDAADGSAMDNLQASLDAAMSNIDSEESNTLEEFPSDENISGGDVSNVLSDMFGDDAYDDSTESKSPFSNLNIPKEVAPDSFNARDVQSEDISLTNDSSLFGLMEKIDTNKDEVSAAPVEDQPMSVDSAFASIFGEDELPEEITPAAEVEQTIKPAPAEDQPMSVDSAFASIFGEDELPEENSVASLDSALASENFTMPEEVESPKEETIQEESIVENQPALANDIHTNESVNLDSTFDSLFGNDELPEESSNAETSSFEKSFTDEFVQKTSESVSGFATNEQTESADDSVQSVNNAFASIFGEDEISDEKNVTEDVSHIFNENPETRIVAPENESLETLDLTDSKIPLVEQVEKVEDELDLPSNSSNELEQEIGGAFNSIFGNNDDLNFDESKDENSSVQESTSAIVEESLIPSSVDNSLESEVSGAFKDLFHTEDDVVIENEEHSNKGVDFLMSGDSDDEVSVGLIKDPSQPLAKGIVEIDESLNTRTLAEIYYEQGLYNKALDIYQDLCIKEPSNAEYQQRAEEIQKICRDKFGGNSNG